MSKRFVLRRGANADTYEYFNNKPRGASKIFWVKEQRDASVFNTNEAEVWNNCFKGISIAVVEMVEYNPCVDGHDFSDVEVDAWSASGYPDNEVNLDLVIHCRACKQTACVSTTVDVGPRDWTVSGGQ